MDKIMNPESIEKVKNIGIAYNENEFILVFNHSDNEETEGKGFIIPADSIKVIADGIIQTGIMYQKEYSKNIGFTSTEE